MTFVIGANDITNPAAKQTKQAQFGMPILDVENSGTVLFIKDQWHLVTQVWTMNSFSGITR